MALPSSEPAKRLHALFNRRPGTHWDTKEIVKFRQLTKNGAFKSLEDLALIERYTLSQRKKGEQFGYYRRNLSTLLNNWHSELDKAREWERLHPARKPPRVIIPMPPAKSEPFVPSAQDLVAMASFEQERIRRRREKGLLL